MTRRKELHRLKSGEKPNCHDCGLNEWKPIPDSLAQCCPCGAVIVEGSREGEWVRGASLQQWAADLARAATPD